MFDSLFAFFFKYSPYVFQQGEFHLAPSSPVYIAVALAGVAALATVLTYRSAPGDARPARPGRSHNAAAVSGRAGPLLSLPAGPDSARCRPTAEFSRDPPGRFPQHESGRSGRKAARRFRHHDVQTRQPGDESAVQPLCRSGVSIRILDRSRRLGRGSVVRRHPNEARRRPATREGRVCRSSAGGPRDGDRWRRHGRGLDSGIAARTSCQSGSRLYGRRRQRSAGTRHPDQPRQHATEGAERDEPFC